MKEGRWVKFLFICFWLSAGKTDIVQFCDILNEMLYDEDDYYWKA